MRPTKSVFSQPREASGIDGAEDVVWDALPSKPARLVGFELLVRRLDIAVDKLRELGLPRAEITLITFVREALFITVLLPDAVARRKVSIAF